MRGMRLFIVSMGIGGVGEGSGTLDGNRRRLERELVFAGSSLAPISG